MYKHRRSFCGRKSGGVNETFNHLSNGRKLILGKTSKKKDERGVYPGPHTHKCITLNKKTLIAGRLVRSNSSQIQFELVISNRL